MSKYSKGYEKQVTTDMFYCEKHDEYIKDEDLYTLRNGETACERCMTNI